MPVVYQNPRYPNQVSPDGAKAPSTQLDYRSMLNEVTSWNPDVDPMQAGRWINNYLRKVIDMRSWYGLKIKGQVPVRRPENRGRVAVHRGSPFVDGIGTNWTSELIGLQFRTGFTFNYQTIADVISPTRLQLDTPYGGPRLAESGYMIVEAYLDFGANVKRILWATNQQQGWPMLCNVPVQTLNTIDVWRISLGWSTTLATRSATPGGSLLMECWPTPFTDQVFPFEAYQQPPDLVLDDDAPVPWISSDLIVTRAVADALVYKGPRKNPYYDATTSQNKIKEFNERVEQMAQADNDMDQQDVSWDYGEEDGAVGYGNGSTWQQNHG